MLSNRTFLKPATIRSQNVSANETVSATDTSLASQKIVVVALENVTFAVGGRKGGGGPPGGAGDQKRVPLPFYAYHKTVICFTRNVVLAGQASYRITADQATSLLVPIGFA